MTAKLNEAFYRDKSWGAVAIEESRDLPTLKLRYLMQLLGKRAQPDAKLLEVGSGSGRILASIQQRDPRLMLTGVDLSKGQTELARATHKNIEFECANGEALPFADASFDYVIFFDYLEHIERPRQSLDEMLRVLRPGGHLYFVCPAEAQSVFWLSSLIFRTHFKEKTAGHIQRFSRKDLRNLVEQTGFKLLEQKFSYHLLGSIMDYTLFALMLNTHVYKIYWANNAYYARSKNEKKGGLFNLLLRTGNTIAYLESSFLRNVQLTATAVHITAQKPR